MNANELRVKYSHLPVKEVPENVRCNQFGCAACLWYGVECTNGRRYEPTTDKASPCKNYTYCD